MKRKLYLEGDLGEKLGKVFSVRALTPSDAFKCLDANFGDDFKKYLIEAHEKNITFTVEVAGQEIQQEELLMPLKEGDIIVTPLPAGSKSAGAKILTAIVIVAALYIQGPMGFSVAEAASAGANVTIAGINAGTLYTAAMTVAVNLALSGIQQMMLPDPSTDKDQNTSYLFNGSEQNIIEGDPVPVLYGRLRVPGQPIAFETVAGSRALGLSGVVGSISLDSTIDVIETEAAAIYAGPTGDTAPIILFNAGGTSGGGGSTGINEQFGLLNQA